MDVDPEREARVGVPQEARDDRQRDADLEPARSYAVADAVEAHPGHARPRARLLQPRDRGRAPSGAPPSPRRTRGRRRATRRRRGGGRPARAPSAPRRGSCGGRGWTWAGRPCRRVACPRPSPPRRCGARRAPARRCSSSARRRPRLARMTTRRGPDVGLVALDRRLAGRPSLRCVSVRLALDNRAIDLGSRLVATDGAGARHGSILTDTSVGGTDDGSWGRSGRPASREGSRAAKVARRKSAWPLSVILGEGRGNPAKPVRANPDAESRSEGLRHQVRGREAPWAPTMGR